jgi:N4-(beta-N-acetylglucosaminyl)-L-asparaginase
MKLKLSKNGRYCEESFLLSVAILFRIGDCFLIDTHKIKNQMKRLNFIKKASVTVLGLVAVSSKIISGDSELKVLHKKVAKPILSPIRPLVIATWNTPLAVETAAKILQNGGSALDAVEQGCRIEEASEKGQSVGKGDLLDRDGDVTLDSYIMNFKGDYGAVLSIKNIMHVASVAKKVMENTPHVMLVA